LKKKLLAAAIVLATCAPALADIDYSRIPVDIRAKIKAKCIAENPDDYGTQAGCIWHQSKSWLDVQDYVK
jgi:hypothetical protein